METETAEPGLRENGTMAEMATGTGRMKISVARDELVAKLGVVSRAVSTRGTVQVLSGSCCAPTATADAGRHRHGAVAADDARRPGGGRRGRRHPRQAARARAPAPESESRSSTGPRRARCRSSPSPARASVFNAEDGLPIGRGCTRSTATLLETVDRVARSASRDESRRCWGSSSVRGRQARHGRPTPTASP